MMRNPPSPAAPAASLKPAALKALAARADEVARLLKTLSHRNRLMIACDLLDGERSVGDIARRTGAPMPILSRDLARMRAEGLIVGRRASKMVYYRIADPRLARLVASLCETFGAPGKRKH